MAKAACAQFTNIEPTEHVYALVRSERQLKRALASIEKLPGLVMFTLMSTDLRDQLEEFCRGANIPSISVLDHVLGKLEDFLGTELTHKAGGQHEMGAEYFRRMEALSYTMAHDDGQFSTELSSADIILVGVSRTSKTPTSIYLANRGVKTANVPIVPNIPLPVELEQVKGPLIVGLATSPDRLVQIRRNRLLSLHQTPETEYVDLEAVRAETLSARKLFSKNEWPVIDVTRRSVEETAAAIYNLYTEHTSPLSSNGGK
jgi:regulator of PEP synthase PpsR (kinase-PPPase family)